VKDILNKDIAIKVISVIIAIIAWLLVLNTSNPYETATFTSIPLTLENEDFLEENGFVVKNQFKRTIDITVRARRDVIRKIKDSDFEAKLDFSKIKSVNDTTLDITGLFCKVDDVAIVSYNPDRIDIMLSRITIGTFPLNLTSNITVKEGYKVLSITPNVDSITFEEEESLISSIDKVVANLEISNLDGDVTKRVPCKVINKDGKEIASLSKNLTVEVSVKTAKGIRVDAKITGSPADGYTLVSSTVNPSFIYVRGAAEVLDKVASLKTEQININGTKEDVEKEVSLVIPNGITLVDESNAKVNVSIAVEKIINKEITLTPSDIELINMKRDGTLDYRIKSESVTVQLNGRESLLENVTAATLRAEANVAGLNGGTHSVKLRLSLPAQVKQVQDAYAEIEIVEMLSTE
jgi:YbbR domain-containing protein